MLIDNITLAVFEDSGWYRVNYAYADNFIWGQGICISVLVVCESFNIHCINVLLHELLGLYTFGILPLCLLVFIFAVGYFVFYRLQHFCCTVYPVI